MAPDNRSTTLWSALRCIPMKPGAAKPSSPSSTGTAPPKVVVLVTMMFLSLLFFLFAIGSNLAGAVPVLVQRFVCWAATAWDRGTGDFSPLSGEWEATCGQRQATCIELRLRGLGGHVAELGRIVLFTTVVICLAAC